MYCPNCGTEYGEDCRFCGRCGSGLLPGTAAKSGSHRVPILILALLSLLGIVLFFTVSNPSAAGSGTPWFEITGSTISFDESRYDGPAELQVPGSIGGQPVRYLQQRCFADCDELTTVILPEGLQAISWCAFEGCDSLQGIFIPETVSIIDDYAFADCVALEAVSIPSSVTYISPDAFRECPSLKHVFYAGTYEEWLFLTGDNMAPGVSIYCSDGNYCQGIPIP